jgi:hypothetical protein
MSIELTFIALGLLSELSEVDGVFVTHGEVVYR